MKFSLIAVAFAIAFAVTSHAAELNLLTREEKCHGLSITYGSCYNVSEFGKVTAADFVSKDNNNKGITLIFFESGNCGGKYTKISGYWPAESWQYWSQINYVSGNIKSVWMMNTYEAPDPSNEYFNIDLGGSEV
ncbi:hypothetical protein BGX34_003809 [Mortierella sp. NVP85]|nr:hypothetical protein BGX34_003809 [Mortierella sp. NVP85]